MSGAVHREVGAVRVAQAEERGGSLHAECLPRDDAKQWTGKRNAAIGEADQALIKGGIPQSREQEAIVNIEALLVVAIRPWHDVRSAQKRWLGDARERTPAAPIVYERV